MPEHSMRKKIEEATFADLVAFYSHLKNLIKAGVPIQPGIQEIDIRRLTSQDREAHSPNDSNSRAPSDASSFDVWPLIRTNPKFPRNFRLAFAAWIASDKHPDAFQILNYAKQTSVLKSLSWVWQTSLRLVFLFAMITLLLWQATGGTALKNLYKDSSFPPGPIGSINIQINNYLSDWMATTSPI